MAAPTQAEITEALRELLTRTPPPVWLVEMIEHYRRTGTFRPEDLHRLVGDPNRGVRVDPNATVDAILAGSDPQRYIS
jgi:hypothetical protein